MRLLLLYVWGFFVVTPGVAIAECFCGGAICGADEWCRVWTEDMGNGLNYNYDCVACDDGEVPNAACNGCEIQHCYGYNSTCPSEVASGRKCKEVSGCSTNGCQKYEVCNPSNGNIEYAVGGSCHLEGNDGACYSNQRNCDLFGRAGSYVSGNSAVYSGVADWVQHGGGYKWDVGACTGTVQDITDNVLTNCKKMTMVVSVASENRYIASAQTAVTYYTSVWYCKQCLPGFVPVIIVSPYDTIVTRPAGEPGNWGVAGCTTVTAPNYAEGCVIDFSASSGETVLAACKKSCSVPGHTITQDGATSESQCTIDSSQIYSDNTGRFTIGAGQCSP